ncbi:hypothetical protein D3C73_1054710 [compost metagenome]
MVVICRRNQFGRIFFICTFTSARLNGYRWHAPIAITVFGEDVIFHVPLLHVAKPLFDGWIIISHRIYITGLFVEHFGNEHNRTRPAHVIAVISPKSRGNIGDGTIFLLCISDILQPLGVKFTIIEQEIFAMCYSTSVAQPGHAFVALRAVDRDTLIVTGNSPPGIFKNLVG